MSVAIILKTCENGADFFGKVIACCAVFCDLFYQCGKGGKAGARKNLGPKKKLEIFFGDKNWRGKWRASGLKTARLYPDCPAGCANATHAWCTANYGVKALQGTENAVGSRLALFVAQTT